MPDARSGSGYELVRMASELIDEITDGSEPVVVLKTIRQNDGTCELLVVRPDIAAENARLRGDLGQISAMLLPDEGPPVQGVHAMLDELRIARETAVSLRNVERAARELDALVDGAPGRWTLAGEEVQEEAASALLSLHDYLNDVTNGLGATGQEDMCRRCGGRGYGSGTMVGAPIACPECKGRPVAAPQGQNREPR